MTTRWKADYTVTPPIFLPAHLDRPLTDVTKVGDRFRVFVDDQGTVHDGAVYARQAREQLNGINNL